MTDPAKHLNHNISLEKCRSGQTKMKCLYSLHRWSFLRTGYAHILALLSSGSFLSFSSLN